MYNSINNQYISKKEGIEMILNHDNYFLLRTKDDGCTLIIYSIENEYKGYSTLYYEGVLHVAHIGIGISIMPNTKINEHLGKITIDNYKEFVDIAIHAEKNISTTLNFTANPSTSYPQINDKLQLKIAYDFLYNNGAITQKEMPIVQILTANWWEK